MTSPAWRYKQQCERMAEVERLRRAAAIGERETLASMAEDTAKYELLMAGVAADRKRISEKPQGAERLPLKREACAVYTPFVNKYISTGKTYRNEVLVQVMIWRFDLGEINEAVRLAEIAIAQKQPMPERFSSTTPVFVADAVLDWSNTQRQNGGAVSPYFDFVFDNLDTWPLHDVQKAKYCKFAAELAVAENNFAEAAAFCDRAIGYDANCKIKTMRAAIDKELARISEAQKHEQPTPAGGGGQQSDKPDKSDESDTLTPPTALSSNGKLEKAAKTKTVKAAKTAKAKK